MKKIIYAFAATALLAQVELNAQCTNTAPLLPSAVHSTDIPLNGTTPAAAPMLTQQASADLPNVEYVITLRGRAAYSPALGGPDTTGGGGNVVLGTSVDGIFTPQAMTRYGINPAAGDTLEVIAVGYNLSKVKTLAQALLNNNISPNNPCCNIFALIPEATGFCDSVRAAGIYGSAQVNNLGDVLNVFDAMSTAQLSMEAFGSIMAQVNTYKSVIPTPCGKNDLPLCYGWGLNNRYGYKMAVASSVDQILAVNNFALFPNPATEGEVYMSVETDKNTELTMSMYNLLGERVMQQQFQVNGTFNSTISVASLASGMYIVEINDGKNKMTQKLVVR